ncbi:hypothetical protein BT96DRAFT_981423 [Gymnopus androsaceus JB14]|uniref:G-protein coupled receptors family 1 profile domain-containing protein n=1 Tax=Gymnopus androsaceus JB14 TaxID=1447944 RepID=A0A6A4GPV4_9AGAR|nr:hypothetical protein BT96DRAFT_981423 [Gymnopus androsaceus JB14]
MSQQWGETGILIVQLAALFFSSFFWGIFLITFIQSIRYLLWDSKGVRKPPSTISWPMLITAVLLALFPAFDVALGLTVNIEALKSFTSGSAAGLVSATANWAIILKTCNIILGKLVSDGAWIYRCWVIYNRRWLVVAVPLLLWLAYLSLTIYIITAEVQSAVGDQLLLSIATHSDAPLQLIFPGITAGWAISLVNNLLTSGLIVHRIRMVDMYTQDVAAPRNGTHIHVQSLFSRQRCKKRTRLQNINMAIIESGLLYTTVAFITFSTFLAGSLSFFATSAVEIQVLSIAFNLVIIRGARQNDDVQSSTTGRNLPTLPLQNLVEDVAEVSSTNEESRGREKS